MRTRDIRRAKRLVARARSKAAQFLDAMPPSDPRRPELESLVRKMLKLCDSIERDLSEVPSHAT